MTGSETYWLSILDNLVSVTQPLRGDYELEDEPAWVTKLTLEVINVVTPKMQLRPGIEPTPDRIGVIMGSHLIQMAQAESLFEFSKPTNDATRSAFTMGVKLATPSGFDVDAGRSNLPAVRDKICSVVAEVLKERPLQESAEFFRGFSRGLRQNSKGLTPEIIDGIARFTPEQLRRIGTILVYLLTRHNWREIDKLETSKQAFEWFEKRFPPPLLPLIGNDPERIRKMFYRVGKTFKFPGKPKKRDRVVTRVLR